MNRAVFIDRDGVVTQEPPYYAHKLSELNFVANAAHAIGLLNRNGFLVIVVSNQAGIAHGYYEEEETILFNQAVEELLSKIGAHIDATYYCPHHPQARIERYRVKCHCRKPEPGMLIRAREELNVDLSQSFMIGDKWSDIEAGKRVGCKTIMVKTGQGVEELKTKQIECDYVADDLYDAVEHILFSCTEAEEDHTNADDGL